MATHSGHEGVIKIGAVTVAEIDSFTIEETSEVIDDTNLADTTKTFIAGQKSWTATAEAHWDETDTTGQGACVPGASVTLGVYPEGSTTGDTYMSGNAIVTNRSIKNAKGSTVTASFSFQGSGVLTTATV